MNDLYKRLIEAVVEDDNKSSKKLVKCILSKENYDKLNKNYLYQREPMERGSYTDVYWCRNWTFTVRKTADGEAYMYDTYFNNWDSAIRVTDDNINDFEVVFDFRNVERVPDSFRNEYEDDDLYYVATDSGGYSCGDLYWKDKNTKPSLKKQINKKRQAVKDAEYELEYAKRDLKSFVTENNINTNDYPEES